MRIRIKTSQAPCADHEPPFSRPHCDELCVECIACWHDQEFSEPVQPTASIGHTDGTGGSREQAIEKRFGNPLQQYAQVATQQHRRYSNHPPDLICKVIARVAAEQFVTAIAGECDGYVLPRHCSHKI